jgi:hypothetical protein
LLVNHRSLRIVFLIQVAARAHNRIVSK